MAGHIARAADEYPPRKILIESQPVGKRRRGRPHLRWEDRVQVQMKMDRQRWGKKRKSGPPWDHCTKDDDDDDDI